MKRRKFLIAFLLISAAIVSIDCNANRLILGSDNSRIDPGSARREMIQSDGRSIECWVAQSSAAKTREPEAFVLFFVGKGARVDGWMDAVANAWDAHAVEVWGMNYPGSGGTSGPITLAAVAPNALAVHDALRRRAGNRPIFIQAASFGTAVALHVASHRCVRGLVLQNPPPLRQLILGRYGWWNLWLIAGPVAAQVPDELDSLKNAAHCTAPAVFILSAGDMNVPRAYQQQVVDAYAGPKHVIEMPGAGHDTPLSRDAAERLKADKRWMWEMGAGR